MNVRTSRIVFKREEPEPEDVHRDRASSTGGRKWRKPGRGTSGCATRCGGVPAVPRQLLARARPAPGVPGSLRPSDDRGRIARRPDPAEYGGLGLSLTDASIILEEVNRSGGNAGPSHAQMYMMGTLLRHGSEAQKREYLPRIARGEMRLQAFGVTEPEAGTDTTAITTTRRARTATATSSMVARSTSRACPTPTCSCFWRAPPRAIRCSKRSHGLSVFLIDLHEAIGNGLTVRPIHDHDQQRDERAACSRTCAIPAGSPGWGGRPGVPLHPRRHERRAHPDRRRVRRRRPLVHRASGRTR